MYPLCLAWVIPYFVLTSIVATSFVGTPFRGFLLSEALRISKFNLAGWLQKDQVLSPFQKVSSIQNYPINTAEELGSHERLLNPEKSFSVSFINLVGEKTVIENLRVGIFDKKDLLMTYGILCFAALSWFFLSLISLGICPPHWRFSLFFQGFLGTVWLLSAFDYFSTYTFNQINALASAFFPAAIVHYFLTALKEEKSKNEIRLVKIFYFSASTLAALHLLTLRNTGRLGLICFLSLFIFYLGSLFSFFLVVVNNYRKRSFSTDRDLKSTLILFALLTLFFLCFCVWLLLKAFGLPLSSIYFALLINVLSLATLTLCISERFFEKYEQMSKFLKSREKLKALGFLSAGLAHEIRNPLNNIAMCSHSLNFLMEQPRKLQKEVGRMVQIITENVGRIDAIIEDFDKFAKGKFRFAKTILVSHLIEMALKNLNLKILEKEILIERDLPEDFPILGSETAIVQSLTNIVDNALDASPKGKSINISGLQSGTTATISIKDFGEEIEKSELPFIFDPFFTTKDTGRGMGLGLWVTHQIIEALGGKIEVKSAVGEGTEFKIHLPRASGFDVGRIQGL